MGNASTKFSGIVSAARQLPAVLILVVTACLSAPLSTNAQEADKAGISVPTRAEAKETSLSIILQSITQAKNNLRQKQRELRGPEGEGRQQELTLDIARLARELEALEQNFKEIASGIDLDRFTHSEAEKDVSWNREFRELIGPLLNELKMLTSSPREIDRLKSIINEYDERLAAISEAEQNVSSLLKSVQDRGVRRRLGETQKSWVSQRQTIETQRAVASQKLSQRLSERKSLGETVENLFHVFFQRRGRNLLLALICTLGFWLFVRRLHFLLHVKTPLRRKKLSFAARLFNVLYLILSIMGTALVFLLVLYLFGDWVLLIAAMMLLIGLAWASKEAIPQFWSQTVLLLNMGPVREGERIDYRGLPWRVRKINFYTDLENEALDSPRLRLPLSDLGTLRSRPYFEQELWFPTRSGEWVELDDGTFGCIERQTVERVSIRELGGALKHYLVSDFLSQKPRALSQGFRIQTTFGIDYGHQAQVTTVIPMRLKEAIIAGLNADGQSSEDVKLSVEFKEAGSSSLDIAVLADFQGSAAPGYKRLQRRLQALCVDCCNENNWVIPFPQLTVHMNRQTLSDDKC